MCEWNINFEVFFKILKSLYREKTYISKVTIVINIYSEVLKYSKNGEKYYSYGPINKTYNYLFIMRYMSNTTDQFI